MKEQDDMSMSLLFMGSSAVCLYFRCYYVVRRMREFDPGMACYSLSLLAMGSPSRIRAHWEDIISIFQKSLVSLIGMNLKPDIMMCDPNGKKWPVKYFSHTWLD